MLNQAYILAVYKNASQAIRLFERLNSPDTVFAIHICLNAEKSFVNELHGYFKTYNNVWFAKRERATVFRYGIVDAVMNSIEVLLKNNVKFDYITSLSGQDYPIKPVANINNFIERHRGKEFITYHKLIFDNNEDYAQTLWGRKEAYRFEDYWMRFSRKGHLYRFPVNRFIDKPLWNVLKIYFYEFPDYIRKGILLHETTELIFSRIYSKKKTFLKGFEPYGGWAWWTLTYDCARYMLETYRKTPAIKAFFKYSWTPDEMVYQTIILNSPFKDNIINDDLREIVFSSKEHSHPNIYTSEDFEFLKKSEKLFARKFDITVDSTVLDMIDNLLPKSE